MDQSNTAEDLLLAMRQGTETWETLKQGFAHLSDEHERDKALQGLGILLSDPNPWLRLSATSALGALGDQRAVEPLIQSLSDDDEEVGEDLIYEKFVVLASFKDVRAVVPLIQQLHRVDFKCAWTLERFDEETVRLALIDALKHSHPTIREQVSSLLCGRPHSDNVKPLIEVLNDESLTVRINAIWALSDLGSVEAIPSLLNYVADPEPDIRRHVAKALGKLHAQHAVLGLVALLTDVNRDVQIQAACALGRLGRHEGLPLVLEALSSKDYFHSQDAVDAVKELRYPAVDILIDLANYLMGRPMGFQRPETLIHIAEAFETLGDTSALETLRKMLDFGGDVQQLKKR